MLPTPNATDRARSDRLLQEILHAIRTHHGSIAFADYMERALYTPELGYYSGERQPFGPQGDFVTAPEISPLFSACLARHYEHIADTVTEAETAILEIGAGSGQMAADILLALAKNQRLPMQYLILEKSKNLQQRQQQTLARLCPEHQHRVQWIDKLPTSGSFKGLIVANEVLDAMPVHRFQIHHHTGYELRVVEAQGHLKGQAFAWDHPALKPLEALARAQDWPSPYCSEINLHLQAWMQDLSACLKQGVILLIDYGFPASEYYHPDRCMGTLMCHHRHRAHTDPFVDPGLHDITAHVDFSAVAAAAHTAGLALLGYTHQAAFLLGCGIHTLEQPPTNTQARILQQQALQQLLSPTEMGELFKVIAFGRGIETALMGFEWLDLQHKL
jgi:SAM-dependent MidA family methyltransferase